MKERFTDKRVIITGGSGGIGSVVTEGFLREGARVLVLSVDKTTLKTKKEEFKKISPKIATASVDVSDRVAVAKLETFINEKFGGRVDVLVNAAAIYGPMGKLEETDLEHWQKTIEVNLFGTVNMCALVIPFMKRKGEGRIINFSGGGDGAFPRFTAYSASKGAILRFTESLAKELSEEHIYVNAVAPGAINNKLLDEVLKAGEEKVGKEFFDNSKKQKKEGGASPTKVRDLILFLSSSESGNLSGKLLSAIYDDWKNMPKHLDELSKTDIYNIRRIKPADRGYDW